MIEFLTHVVLPIVQALFVPLDFLLGWVAALGPFTALIIVGAITGLAVNLFQKYGSNQELLGRRRADLARLKVLTKEAKLARDGEKKARLSGLTSQISSKYAFESMKPALYSIPPMCLLAMWVGARLSFEPVRPGDVVEVIATFEAGATGFSHVVPNDGLTPDGPAIAPIAFHRPAPTGTSNVAIAPPPTAVSSSPEARWKIRAEKEGDHLMQIRHGEDRYDLAVPVRAKGGPPPEQATVFRAESPTGDKLLSIELKLREPVPAAWWNLFMQSMGLYLVIAMLFGFGLRRVMGIQ